jgi:hypothetical protein
MATKTEFPHGERIADQAMKRSGQGYLSGKLIFGLRAGKGRESNLEIFLLQT